MYRNNRPTYSRNIYVLWHPVREWQINAKKLDPIIYDGVKHAYWSFGEKVGQAFSDGKKIK